MEDCCEWHGKVLAYNIVEEKYGTQVLASVHYCPHCNSIWKTFVGLDNKEYLTERVWGDLKDTYLNKYAREISEVIEEAK